MRKRTIFIVSIALLVSLCSLLLMLWNAYEPMEPTGHPSHRVLSHIGADSDKEWLHTMRAGEIVNIVPYNPYGLSEKFKVIFSNGFVCSGKHMEPFSFWEKKFDVVDQHKMDPTDAKLARRTWGVEQGWNELVAFYIDRALKWYKKPPSMGRVVTNKELYMNDERWTSIFKRMLPEYPIPVALIAWYEGIKVVPPSITVQEIMVHAKKMPHDQKAIDMILQISDVMVFDYLVDDHDRIEAHNWLQDKFGNYIFWDSGLAFRHGAFGRESRDLDIFCGRQAWVDNRGDKRSCRRTCRFRNATIEHLKSLGDEQPKLSELVKREIADDPLYPVLQFNIYSPWYFQNPRIRFEVENFYFGFDKRVGEILNYVRTCEARYGTEKVLY